MKLTGSAAAPVLLAEPGLAWLDGAEVDAVPLAPGQCIEIGGRLRLRVEAVPSSRPGIRALVGPRDVRLLEEGTDTGVIVRGNGMRVLVGLLEASPLGWEACAALAWPDDARIRDRGATGRDDDWTPDDERRYRNRWDGLAVVLRRRLGALRPGLFRVRDGQVLLALDHDDEVVWDGRPPSP